MLFFLCNSFELLLEQLKIKIGLLKKVGPTHDNLTSKFKMAPSSVVTVIVIHSYFVSLDDGAVVSTVILRAGCDLIPVPSVWSLHATPRFWSNLKLHISVNV